MHRFEEIWLIIAVVIIFGSMIVTGYQTFAFEMGPPSYKETLDPEKVDEHELFSEPEVYEVGDNEYDVVMNLEIFSFDQGEIEIPTDAKINYIMTSKDVVQIIQVVNTNINAMVHPGHVQKIAHTFNEPDEYLGICNEYCGAGYQIMAMTITV